MEKLRHGDSEGAGLEAVVSGQAALRVQALLLLAAFWVTGSEETEGDLEEAGAWTAAGLQRPQTLLDLAPLVSTAPLSGLGKGKKDTGLGVLLSFPQDGLPFPTHAAAPSSFTLR